MFLFDNLYQFSDGKETMEHLDREVDRCNMELYPNLIHCGFYVSKHFPGHGLFYGLITSFCSKRKLYQVGKYVYLTSKLILNDLTTRLFILTVIVKILPENSVPQFCTATGTEIRRTLQLLCAKSTH
jgi:hypothetical protein